MRIDRQRIAGAIKLIGFMLVLLWAVWQTGVASVERAQKDDLIDVLRRRSPVTEYQAAEFGHSDCRTNYEDAFLAAIGHTLSAPRDSAALQVAVSEVARLTDVLGHIELHCPTPRPPVFSDDGKLVTPPFIPDTTTSTTSTLPPDG